MGFFSKIFKSPLFKVAAPIALSATGIGAPLGAAISGGLGLGLGAAGASALGSGLIGAGLGAAEGGGLKGALMGGVPAGIGGYIQGAGGLGNALSSAANNAGFGNSVYNALDNAGTSTLGKVLSSGAGSGVNFGNVASNIYSGIAGNSAINSALKQQQAATDQALQLQAKQYGQTSANLNPFITSGQASNNTLSSLLGLGGDPASAAAALQADPGYQFRLQQGQQAVDRSMGAKGNLFSGAALKAAQDYGQGLASQSYNDLVSHLQSQSNAGQQAASSLGGFGSNYANAASNLYTNQGDANANAILKKSGNINTSLANIFGTNVGGVQGGLNSQYSNLGGLSDEQLRQLAKQRGIQLNG